MELKSTLGLNKTLEDIKKDKVSPVYLIYGDQDYLTEEAAEKIVEAILPEKDRETNLETTGGNGEDWDKILQSLSTYPLFGSRRVILAKDTGIFFPKFTSEKLIKRSMERFEAGDVNEAVRLYRMVVGYEGMRDITDKDLDELPGYTSDPMVIGWLKAVVNECVSQGLKPIPYEDDSDKLDKVLKKDTEGKGKPQNNILILTAEHIDRRKKLYKTIEELGIVIDFTIERMRRDPAEIEAEERRTLQQQAVEILRQSKKKLTKEAFESLLSKTGYDVGMFLNELEKVIISVKDRQQIEPRDIEEIVGRTKEDSNFDLQKAVGRRDFERATFYLRELLGQGEFYLPLLQNIANEIRSLIAAKELVENELKGKWNPQMDEEAFKRFVYFPIIQKIRKEKEKVPAFKKSRYNILKRPTDVLLELLKRSENFTKEELYHSMKLLAETDLKMKSIRTLPVHLLEGALLEICTKERGKDGRREDSESSLREGILKCHRTDLAIKRGQGPKDLLMEKLVIDLCRPG